MSRRAVSLLPFFAVACAPVLAVPFLSAPFELQKGSGTALLFGVALIALSVVLIHSRIRVSAVSSLGGFALMALGLIAVASAYMNVSSAPQIFGTGFEVGVLGFYGLLILSLLFGALSQESERAFLYAWVVAIFVAAGAAITVYLLGVRGDVFSTLTGAWPQLSFCSAGALSLLLIQGDVSRRFDPLTIMSLVALGIVFLVFFHAAAGFALSAVLIVYALTQFILQRRACVPVFLVGVLCFALSYMGVSGLFKMPADIRMSLFVNEVLAAPQLLNGGVGAFLGVGPGQFIHASEEYRPIELEGTPIANQAFAYGYSVLGTLIVELGLLGLLAALVLFGVYIYCFATGLSRGAFGGDDSYRIALYGFGLFGLIGAALYPVQAGFLYAGAFVLGMQARAVFVEGEGRALTRHFSALIACLAGIFLVSIALFQLAAAHEYVKGIARSENGAREEAMFAFESAYEKWPGDLYARDASRATLEYAFSIFGTSAFNERAARAVTLSGSAIQTDPHSYWNWIARASVLVSLASAGYTEVVEDAFSALSQARTLSPSRPEANELEGRLRATLSP